MYIAAHSTRAISVLSFDACATTAHPVHSGAALNTPIFFARLSYFVRNRLSTARLPLLFRLKIHNHGAALKCRRFFDFSHRRYVAREPIEHFPSQVDMRHLPAPEAHGDLYPIAPRQKLLKRMQLHLIIVLFYLRSEPQFLDVYNPLLLFRLFLPLLLLISVL